MSRLSVVLNPGEVAACYELGARRQGVNAGLALRDKFTTPRPFDVHVRGAVAELAFAKLHNVFPDLSCTPRRDTPDFTIRGVTYDVKAVIAEDHVLTAIPGKRGAPCDYYVLAWVRWSHEVEFLGYASATELLSTTPRAVRGRDVKSHALAPHELRPYTLEVAHGLGRRTEAAS